jgi:hypothetical protein
MLLAVLTWVASRRESVWHSTCACERRSLRAGNAVIQLGSDVRRVTSVQNQLLVLHSNLLASR